MFCKTVSLSPERCPHNKAIVTSLKVIADLPKTQRKHKKADKMRRQRNIPQMKKKEKSPQKELKTMEVTKIADADSMQIM